MLVCVERSNLWELQMGVNPGLHCGGCEQANARYVVCILFVPPRMKGHFLSTYLFLLQLGAWDHVEFINII